MLRAAATTFDLWPSPGDTTDSLLGVCTGAVYSPLRIGLLLLEAGPRRLALLTAPLYVDSYPTSNLIRRRLCSLLNLQCEETAVFSSHNHSCVLLGRESPFIYPPPEAACYGSDDLSLTGVAFFAELEAAASRLPGALEPVEVWYGEGREGRVTYNRKGRRADGSAYLMREEDRALLGEDYCGDIDREAPVIELRRPDGSPLAFLVHFTGHPVTAYHPENPVVFGDYAQVAADDLSLAHGGVPVLFLQGCAGEINSRHFLMPLPPATRVAQATRYGHYLGATYIATSRNLCRSTTHHVKSAYQKVRLPFTRVPPLRSLQRDLREIEVFLDRCARNEEATTRTCVGLNFPRSLTPQYRARLVQPVQAWTHWALNFHLTATTAAAPTGVDLIIGAFRIGDVGLVGLPCEPLLGIGRQIRAAAPYPLTIPCGYMNDNIAYVPDAPNLRDRDYNSSFYRYTTCLLPYRHPGGNLLARAGTKLLQALKDPHA